MSTRRARIKAVASLPVRRKNPENDEKKKQVQGKKESTSESSITANKDCKQEVSESNIDPVVISESTVLETSNKSEQLINHSLTSTTSSKDKEIDKIDTINKESNLVLSNVNNNIKDSEYVPVVTGTAKKHTPDIHSSSISGIKKHENLSTPKESEKSEKVLNKTPILFKASNVFTSPLPGSPRGTVIRVDNLSYKPSTPQRPIVHVNIRENEELNTHTGNRKSAATPHDVSDFNPPSVPESVGDDPVMDGIVPLHSHRSAPKPIDLLKNEIISENAEVLFDPIVPLPSPSKVRPKLRPVPRLGPFRRNSIQGSASESEDEARRYLLSSGGSTPAPPRQRTESHTSHIRETNRVRNDSISSSISQVQHTVPASPQVKERLSKARRREMSRRLIRRRQGSIRRDQLTMYDLIFSNPTENPMVPDEDEVQAKEANLKEAENSTIDLDEDDPDDPPTDAAPVPQIKLGPNGEIILDEKSLVIKQTQSDRKVSSVVREGSWGTGGGRYTRGAKTADWNAAETVRFYRALAAIGTDFSLMAALFPGRSRRDIKFKFKKEERLNGAQVDMALRSATRWDATELGREFEQEREAEAAEAKRRHESFLEEKKAAKERAKESKGMRLRRSRGAKILDSSTLPDGALPASDNVSTADEFILRSLQQRQTVLQEKLNRKRQRMDKKESKINKEPTPQEISVDVPVDYSKVTPQPELTPTNSTTPQTKSLTPREPKIPTPHRLTTITSTVHSNIESGSLVVLTVRNPNSPSKQMLQTYMSHGNGKLTPISLPNSLLNSVVGYVNKSGSSPLVSPASTSSDSRNTPGVIQFNPSPVKRQRHSSYTITQL